MSIEEFESALKSKLLTDFNDSGYDYMVVDITVWKAHLSEDEYEKFLHLTSVLGDYQCYVKVDNIPKIEIFARRNNLQVWVSTHKWFAELEIR